MTLITSMEKNCMLEAMQEAWNRDYGKEGEVFTFYALVHWDFESCAYVTCVLKRRL